MKKPKHFFNLESKSNQSNEHLIYFNLNYGYKEFDVVSGKYKYIPLRISTQWTIPKEYWRGRPDYRANQTYVRKFGKDINNNLATIQDEAYNQLSIYWNNYKTLPNPLELKDIVLEKLDRIQIKSTDVPIINFIDEVIKERKKLPPSSKLYWGTSTTKQYENLKAHIDHYQSRANKILTFAKLSESEYWDIFDSINKRNQEIEGESIKHNTIAKICKHLRVIMGIAEKQNIEIGFQWNNNGYKINEVDTKNNLALDEDQLLTIYNTDTSHSKEFHNARAYILFSSLTALRIGDMVELHNCQVETYTVNGTTFPGFRTIIRKTKGATNELSVIIPLPKYLLQMIEVNDNNFPKFPSRPVIGRQIKKFLKFLKFKNKVQFKEWYYPEPKPRIEEHEQHEVFNPHSCRYTFITNMSKLGVPESVVKNITHPTLKARNILAGYDLSSMEQNAYSLYQNLKTKNSKIYRY